MSDYPIRIKGDVVVCAPADPRRLSTAVLLEQEDWFEKEIGFLRRWLRPGMRAIDIGANIGVYTLTIAQRVGREGAVWAFEPTPAPATSLMQSIARNGFDQVTVVQRALSDQEGRATFHTGDQSELNSLVHSVDATEMLSVEVSTLDHEQERLGWKSIDFVKIDAEGVCAHSRGWETILRAALATHHVRGKRLAIGDRALGSSCDVSRDGFRDLSPHRP